MPGDRTAQPGRELPVGAPSTIAGSGRSGEASPDEGTGHSEAGQVQRIGVVSDTHGQVAYAREAVRMLESLEVQLVLHCGDIGSVEIVPLFHSWPTHFVFGNVDYDVGELRAAIRHAGQHCHERFGSLDVAGKRLAFLHGDETQLLRQTAASGKWDLVCYGHTHESEQHREGKTLVLNPGALYRANPHSLAIVDLSALSATIISV
jgi:uncharacterized protein